MLQAPADSNPIHLPAFTTLQFHIYINTTYNMKKTGTHQENKEEEATTKNSQRSHGKRFHRPT